MAPVTALIASDCLTPFGHAGDTLSALCRGERALQMHPVSPDCEDKVPLALIRPLEAEEPARWLEPCRELLRGAEGYPWGRARYPVIVTSSNFGIGQLLAYALRERQGDLSAASPERAVGQIARALEWGPHRMILSNACVSAQLGLFHAARMLYADLADAVLVFSFDFLSPFVAGGFHSLKILNDAWPQPYTECEAGSIGLGDGAAYAILGRAGESEWQLGPGANFNECFHMTGNDPSGDGFRRCFGSVAEGIEGRKLWVKGHGTGTQEAGHLEAQAALDAFPEAPLVSWKGSLGHTLGSCGLVELAIAHAGMRAGRIPGNIGGGDKALSPRVQRDAFDAAPYDGAVLVSSAFGGAHAAQVLLCGKPFREPRPAPVLRRYIHAVEALEPVETLDPEMVRAYRKNFPAMTARKLSHLPLMLGQVTREAAIGPDDELLFVSEFGGVQALEKFLASFPAASPIGFQNSTQPGPASLVLVARRQAVRLFTPVVGADGMVNALMLALLADPGPLHLLGGEEHGAWLTEEQLGSSSAFAFYLKLSDEPEGALGSLSWSPGEAGENDRMTTSAFTCAVLARRNATMGAPGGGRLELAWA